MTIVACINHSVKNDDALLRMQRAKHKSSHLIGEENTPLERGIGHTVSKILISQVGLGTYTWPYGLPANADILHGIPMNYWILGTLILSLLSPISYTKSMLAGKAKPHKVTRLIVWLASIAGGLGVIHSSNTAGIIFAAIFFARASYLLVMSLIYGTGGASRLDKSCLLIGILALVAYVITGNGLLAISFGILSDLIGYIPTFAKTWHQPKSEDPLFFGIESLASLLAIFAIWELRVDILFPIYFFVCGTFVVFLIYRKQLAHKLKVSSYPEDVPQ